MGLALEHSASQPSHAYRSRLSLVKIQILFTRSMILHFEQVPRRCQGNLAASPIPPRTPLLVSTSLCSFWPLSVHWFLFTCSKERNRANTMGYLFWEKVTKRLWFLSWGYSPTRSEESHLLGCELSYSKIDVIRNWYHWTKASKAEACHLLLAIRVGLEADHRWIEPWDDRIPSNIWLQTCEESLNQRHSVNPCPGFWRTEAVT